ncbi:putative skeletal organic matrix protein 5 isoform X1 [Acropora palmata]|uniref:putative skeletal organic matrix protein 5 isoform X1 n=1 Tax=Acropora palmata TaxID=6131 RepID=UPI003DA022EC
MLCLRDSYIFIFKKACEILFYFPIVPKQLDHKLKLDNKDNKDNKHNNKSYYNSVKGNKLSFSCALLSTYERRTKSQVYTLMLGSRNIPVYCFMGDFGCGSGGWTLVMKTDGTKNTFHYSSPFWSDREVYNLAGGKTGFDKQETKLPSYWETHFSKICLGMRNSLTTRFVVIRRSANSLYSLIADGIYRRFPLGRNKWKYLAGPQASLQTNCNKEGFNVVGTSSQSKARIGIIGNQQNDCSTCDSRIGLGNGGLHDDSNTCGNEATRSSDNGDKHIKAMGYILVQ